MANTLMNFSYSILDSLGVTATSNFLVSVPTTLTLENIQAIWIALGTLLDAATDGKVVRGQTMQKQVQDVSWKDAPVSLSKNVNAAIIEFSLTGTTHQASVVVPAVISGSLTGGRLNINATGLKEFIYGCYHGFGAGSAYKVTNLTSNTPTGVNRGFLGSRRHRKQQQPKTEMSGGSFVPPA